MPSAPGRPRFAAFDVGTNTVLMAVAERDEDGRLVPVLERSELTRLGEGVGRTGELSKEGLERTVSALARFAGEARAAGAGALCAGATSAARDARNRADLVAMARQRAQVEVEILPGDEEARLTFRAVQEDFGEPGCALAALDIGGGSTELTVGAGSGPPAFRQSVDVGSVRLTERFVTAHPLPEEAVRALRAHLRDALSAWAPLPSGARLVAVAATATTLYAIQRGLPSAEDPRVQGGQLSLAALEPQVERLGLLSLEERRAVRGLDPRRADVICAGGWILVEALRQLGAEECQVSDRGVRWGLLWERFGKGRAGR